MNEDVTHTIRRKFQTRGGHFTSPVCRGGQASDGSRRPVFVVVRANATCARAERFRVPYYARGHHLACLYERSSSLLLRTYARAGKKTPKYRAIGPILPGAAWWRNGIAQSHIRIQLFSSNFQLFFFHIELFYTQALNFSVISF